MGKDRNNARKLKIKSRAKDRAYDSNSEDLEIIIKELESEKRIIKTKDDYNKQVVIGRIQLAHGNQFQTELFDTTKIQVVTPGNRALHDMIKQMNDTVPPDCCKEQQLLILIRLPDMNQSVISSKSGQTLALITDDDIQITNERIERLKNAGIFFPDKEETEIIFEDEQEIELGVL